MRSMAHARPIGGGHPARSIPQHGIATHNSESAAATGDPGDAAALFDLRRRRPRRMPASLAGRADYLPPDEAALLRSVYHDGVTINALAAIAGLRPATIRSRLRRILRRIEDPCFAFVLASRDAWPPPMARVATACFLHGRTLRRAAADLNMSVAAVRRYRDAAAALCEAHRAAQRTKPRPTRPPAVA